MRNSPSPGRYTWRSRHPHQPESLHAHSPERHRTRRQHAPRAHQPPDHRHGSASCRQAGIPESCAQRQGSDRAGDDRRGAEGRQDQERHDRARADIRQHRHRTGHGLRGARNPLRIRHAGDDEPRTSPAAQGVRRGTHPDARTGRHDRRHQKGTGDGCRPIRAISFRSSSRIPPIRRSTARPRRRRSGATPTARSTSSCRASVPAARSPASAKC